MGEFFKPLRRKIGVVTLAVACLFAAGWVRSLCVYDIIPTFPPYHYAASTNGHIETIRSKFSPEDWKVTVIPYWPIVVPLTLLSAWLLLSRPRAKKPPDS